MRWTLHSLIGSIAALLIGATELAAAPSSHPIVPGFERFFAANSTNLWEGGELLLSELRCVNCHDPGKHKERIPTLSGPRLDDLPTRLSFDYLVDWLSRPHAVKPGALMPHMLSGMSDEAQKEDAKALAFYLFSTAPFPAERNAVHGSMENGRRLFHSIGCIACHAPEEGFKPEDASPESITEPIRIPSIPLGDVANKFSSEGLVAFLLDPLKWHPDARMPRTPMSADEARDLAAYLSKGNLGGGVPALLPPYLVEKGAKKFAELNCAACHSVGGEMSETELNNAVSDGNPLSQRERVRVREKVSSKQTASESLTRSPSPVSSPSRERKTPDVTAVTTDVVAKPLAELDSNASGCLSETPSRGVPEYQLSPLQREAIIAALKNLSAVKPLTASERVHRQMLALNCYACHQRNGVGGPEPGRAVFFQTDGVDLEDEGRFPPPLNGVGRKLLPETLKKVLRGEDPIRPYMTTRMSDFGEQHSDYLAKVLTAADLVGKIKPTPRDGNEHLVGRGPWGRDLIGTEGVGCIYCHDLKGNKSLGIRAVDLAHAPKRLRAEWFRDYLIDPVAFKPGTRMPSFWPEGKAVHESLGKNTERQIDSLWVYLTELDQNRLPVGMEAKGNFELKPTNAPIVFRTFMQEAGLHAIAVGFPESVHVAFDSERVRWAMAWRGQFLDAEGTWDDRFAPLAEPLGTNVLRWPGGSEVGDVRRFKGYRLNARGVPTFLYAADAGEVEDTVEPGSTPGSLRRTIQLKGASSSKWLGLLSRHYGGKIESVGRNAWSVGDMQLRIIEPVKPNTTIIQNNGSQHLIASPEFDANGEAKIVMEVSW